MYLEKLHCIFLTGVTQKVLAKSRKQAVCKNQNSINQQYIAIKPF